MQRAMKVESDAPHVLLMPFYMQGHIKPMLGIAELLSHAGFYVTFVNTDHNHRIFLSTGDVSSLCKRYPGFRFECISDGLPLQHSRRIQHMDDFYSAMRSVTMPLFRQLLVSLRKEGGERPPLTCIITDAMLSFPVEVANEFNIPTFIFTVWSSSTNWILLHAPKLIEQGELPFQGDCDMDAPITWIPGLENLMVRRDLSGLFGAKTRTVQLMLREILGTAKASRIILNTCEELEATTISEHASFFSKVYPIAPQNSLVKSRTKNSWPSVASGVNLWNQDRSCMTWLDAQASRSVVYVSFGSIVVLSRDQLLELWHGLLNSGKAFLWVIRPDSVAEGEDNFVENLEKLERACIVGWAPQEEVLLHPAIGGFLSHCGWNSVLDSIVAGVPMICWPQLGDQFINACLIRELFKFGLIMNKSDRLSIETLVRDLMGNKREELMKSMDAIAEITRQSIAEGGSSYRNFEKLIEDIKAMNLVNGGGLQGNKSCWEDTDE